MHETYKIWNYRHMPSGHNRTALDLSTTSPRTQCHIGRDLISLGKVLTTTTQDAEGIEAALVEINRLQVSLLAVAEYNRRIGVAK